MGKRLALIGSGLIGGSAAWAMRQAGLVDTVWAYDINPAAAQNAVTLGLAQRATLSVAQAVEQADYVLVAVPVRAMQSVFTEVGQALRPEAYVTDVGSTRQSVIEAARRGLGEKFARYAPVHPIAGGEMPGVEYARADLFYGCKAISTPEPGMSEEAVACWEGVWQKIGAHVSRMTAQEHDAIFAAVSHVPHVLAYTLVDAMAQSPDAAKKFYYTGAGFRDFTRIAASSPAMWVDICLANSAAILQSMQSFEAEFSRVKKAVEERDAGALSELFSRACQARRAVEVRAASAENEKRRAIEVALPQKSGDPS